MSRDEKLKANQRRLAAKRRAKRMAQAMTKKSTTEKPKTSKPKTSNNTKVAFDKKTNFGDYSLKSKEQPTRRGAGVRTPLSGGVGGTRPPQEKKKKETVTPTPPSDKAVKGGYTISGGQRKAGSRGSTNPLPMPSNPAVGYSKPVRRNFKTQAAFLKALEVYMRRKKRGEEAARSTGKGKAKQATDGRQYGG